MAAPSGMAVSSGAAVSRASVALPSSAAAAPPPAEKASVADPLGPGAARRIDDQAEPVAGDGVQVDGGLNGARGVGIRDHRIIDQHVIYFGVRGARAASSEEYPDSLARGGARRHAERDDVARDSAGHSVRAAASMIDETEATGLKREPGDRARGVQRIGRDLQRADGPLPALDGKVDALSACQRAGPDRAKTCWRRRQRRGRSRSGLPPPMTICDTQRCRRPTHPCRASSRRHPSCH